MGYPRLSVERRGHSRGMPWRSVDTAAVLYRKLQQCTSVVSGGSTNGRELSSRGAIIGRGDPSHRHAGHNAANRRSHRRTHHDIMYRRGLQDRRPSHSYHAGMKHVGCSPMQGRHLLHQEQSVVKCSVNRIKGGLYPTKNRSRSERRHGARAFLQRGDSVELLG